MRSSRGRPVASVRRPPGSSCVKAPLSSWPTSTTTGTSRSRTSCGESGSLRAHRRHPGARRRGCGGRGRRHLRRPRLHLQQCGQSRLDGGIEDVDMAMFDRTVAIHLRGVFLGIRAAARVMKPQGTGSIVNTSSVAGLAANYAGHDYSACKAAIAHLTRTTANELGEHGVRVNAICPGGIATSIFARAAGLEGDAAQATVEFMASALGDMAPIRRAGRPIDIAEAALWLASDVVELRERSGHRRRRRPHHRPSPPGAARPDRRAHGDPADTPVLSAVPRPEPAPVLVRRRSAPLAPAEPDPRAFRSGRAAARAHRPS